MTGEEFLRGLAAETVEEVDVEHWWERFSQAFEALDLVGAVDVRAAKEVGEQIRSDLARRTGQEIPNFYLASRHGGPEFVFDRPPMSHRNVTGLAVRAAWAELPSDLGSGAVNFVSQTVQQCWLVCSGAGPAPWPRHDPELPSRRSAGGFTGIPAAPGPYLSPELAMFRQVVDDRHRQYELSFSSSGESSGVKRQRWDLRAGLQPPPGDDANWLRFETPRGPISARLILSAPTTITTRALDPTHNPVEYYLNSQLHDHVWLHLLDPERPLAGLATISEALVAVGALEAEHALARAISVVDDAIAGGDSEPLPTALAQALNQHHRGRPWVGSVAVGAIVAHPDGALIGVEALVGHPDRLALHFIQSEDNPMGAFELVATAMDNQGRGHVAHAEALSGFEEGAFHFRPPLADDADSLIIRFEGPGAIAEVTVELKERPIQRPGAR